ncbi:uncharacterized protein LOC114538214 [Dendronephthya gigantea]|uniref:uncharacterized protein LOC114538214 n=1 Tax=Dendronephthya gigantea TaxID=151771 RepID=UPI00106C4F73|nr:uncharacterized protein LOC114538214 [Dendronephthya gigantea]
MKANRAQYRKNWTAAARSLKRTSAPIPVEVDDTELFELPFDSAPPNHDTVTVSDDHDQQPVKRICTSVVENHLSNHDRLNLDETWHDNSISSSDSENDNLLDDSLAEGLTNWANRFMIKHNALDGLLSVLKENGHPNLPLTARALLHTSRNITIQEKSGMEYVYFPLANQLLKHFKKYPSDIIARTNSLEISLNVDGLPLFKSSRKCLWPVLCAIVNITPVVVFPVVLTCGNSKPVDLDFLDDLIGDLNNLLQNGLQDGETVLSVCLRCVVCDAPARALVKGTKLCSGYFGCDKCAQKGIWVGRVLSD